ncbi:MAG: hypothetical protein FRX48_06258 [Lasallia pustulata]|uniref:Uncharacterized protein n=1 Tax=Lasallia pustulata TaxID=136370 RepID=A0A5M8PLM2_9LECA|nr:MAG: hypothetical protein FRX48_06258 [Lasallia pustulata]
MPSAPRSTDDPSSGLPCHPAKTIASKSISNPKISPIRALHVAFGWATTHTYDFKIKDPQAEKTEAPDLLAHIMRRMEDDKKEFTADMSDPYWKASGERMLLRLVQAIDTQPSAIPGHPAIDSMFDSQRKNRETPRRAVPRCVSGRS